MVRETKETLIPSQRVTDRVEASFFASKEQQHLSIKSADFDADDTARVTLLTQRLVKGEWIDVARTVGGGERPMNEDGKTPKAPFGVPMSMVRGEQYRVTVEPSKSLTLALEAE